MWFCPSIRGGFTWVYDESGETDDCVKVRDDHTGRLAIWPGGCSVAGNPAARQPAESRFPGCNQCFELGGSPSQLRYEGGNDRMLQVVAPA